MFNIYLQRSENAKGKSMRQILLVLTAIIAKSESPQAVQLRKRSATTLLEIICGRQDRIKVKPALQGLAHFLLRDLVSIAELVEILEQIPKRSSATKGLTESAQTLFVTFLTWVVHHDTALSAGHLVKNFLVQARRSPNYTATAYHEGVAPLWIVPVVQTLADWPDRIQEFKTHVFPHCFLPNIEEYMRVLSYLHFSEHVQSAGKLPKALCDFEKLDNQLDSSQEFRILLAAIEAGKELTIIRDNGTHIGKCDIKAVLTIVFRIYEFQRGASLRWSTLPARHRLRFVDVIYRTRRQTCRNVLVDLLDFHNTTFDSRRPAIAQAPSSTSPHRYRRQLPQRSKRIHAKAFRSSESQYCYSR